jgi:hypothetical protein
MLTFRRRNLETAGFIEPAALGCDPSDDISSYQLEEPTS